MFFQTWFADRIWWIDRFRSYSDVTDIWGSPVFQSPFVSHRMPLIYVDFKKDIFPLELQLGFFRHTQTFWISNKTPGHSLLGKMPKVTMRWCHPWRFHKPCVFPCRKWVVEVGEDLWQNRRNFNWKLEDLPLDLQPRNQKLLKFTAILPLPSCLSKLHSTEWSCGNTKFRDVTI